MKEEWYVWRRTQRRERWSIKRWKRRWKKKWANGGGKRGGR